MKVSFSLSSSKNSSKPSNSTSRSSPDHNNQSTNKEFITEFDPSKTLTNPNPNPNPNPNSKPPIIIPPIPNEWNPKKQPTTINPNIQFKSDPNTTVDSIASNITYGLNIRNKKRNDSDTNSKDEQSMSSIDRLMLMKMRSDLERLPNDRGLDEFADVSVADFPSAYLKGYGWFEGRGIGKNAKEDVKVVEFTNRIGREGLGFVRTDNGDH